MTRGTLFLINVDGEVWSSIEFNGDMGMSQETGAKALKGFAQVENFKDFATLLGRINENFGYEEDLLYKEEDAFNSSLYFLNSDKYCSSDWVYILNLSSYEERIRDRFDGCCAIKPQYIAAFYFGKLVACNKKEYFVNRYLLAKASFLENLEIGWDFAVEKIIKQLPSDKTISVYSEIYLKAYFLTKENGGIDKGDCYNIRQFAVESIVNYLNAKALEGGKSNG